jgi:methionyl-tRNA synthetase
MAKKYYITTAIPYVNARPHIGHAFEFILADAIARWHKLIGEKVFFLTGTDENAQKNAQAAKAAGIPTKKFVDDNSKIFIELCKKLNVNYDDFVRTTEARHKKTSHDIIKKVYKKGDIYKGKYEGLYCAGCEAFVTEKDLVDGKCPEHDKVPELISEEAYFFKLSKYKEKLLQFIPSYIIPESRRNEIISRLKEQGLKDLCITRTNFDWGIEFPIDKRFTVYVWFDALVNYITGAHGNWPADLHVIGKGINWFHSVIWPAILMSADYKLPKKLLVHGYLNLHGTKISKSLGNLIDPLELLKKYPADSLRYSLLRCSVFDDSEYSEDTLIERNNNELADKLGNLVSRVSALAEKYGIKKCDNGLFKKLKLKEIEQQFENYETDKALNLLFEFIDQCNLYVQDKKPWETHDAKVLYELADSIKAIAILLWPFIPDTCEKIAKQFSFELKYSAIKKPYKVQKISKGEILFRKIEQEKEEIKQKDIVGVIKMSDIKFDEWQKIDLRAAKILKAEDIEGADKLYKLEVDLGAEKRTVVAGLKQYYKPADLKNKKCVVFCNLEPRTMKGIKSEGMILAAVNADHSKVVLIAPEKDIDLGSRIS